VWLRRNRTPSAPPATGFVGPNERLEQLERACLDRLRTIGTPEAVAAIEEIRHALPDQEWLRLTQDAAERSLRMTPSDRPSPLAILRLVEDHSRSYVSSEADLLAAIINSLDGLQTELIGDDPLARFLWRVPPPEPRDEIDLSIYVAGHLRRDLSRRRVVLNREVNVSRVNRTDIRVEAPAGGAQSRPIVVTIEVKGSWHDELLTAMESQLRDRYLAQGNSKVGLYLVGWFRTPAIEERGPRLSLTEARNLFASQATQLSVAPYIIRAYVLDCAWREEQPKPSVRLPKPRRRATEVAL
jgi:hypothetical protein